MFLLGHRAEEAWEGVKAHETGLECLACTPSGCLVGENCGGQARREPRLGGGGGEARVGRRPPQLST